MRMERNEKFKIYKAIIWIFIAITVLSIISILHSKDIKNLEKQINSLRFEKQYLEYVKEDNERQMQ